MFCKNGITSSQLCLLDFSPDLSVKVHPLHLFGSSSGTSDTLLLALDSGLPQGPHTLQAPLSTSTLDSGSGHAMLSQLLGGERDLVVGEAEIPTGYSLVSGEGPR